MLITVRKGLLILLIGLAGTTQVPAEDYDELDERLRAIEDRMAPVDDDDDGNPQRKAGGMLGMVDDLQRLQEEVRRLRGDVERLQYEAAQNRNRQRDMFLDIEKRLTSLEQGRAGGQGAGVSPTPAAPPVIASPERSAAVGSTGAAAPVVGNPDTPAPAAPGSGLATPAAPPAPPPVAVDPAAEQKAYLQAFELLKQARYDDAIKAFQAFLKSYPNGEYADNARYWLAETYYVKKDYPVALQHFQQLLTEHPDSSKLPGALLKLGYIQYELGNNAEARLALERVRNEFADSSVADLAKQRLDRMDREGR